NPSEGRDTEAGGERRASSPNKNPQIRDHQLRNPNIKKPQIRNPKISPKSDTKKRGEKERKQPGTTTLLRTPDDCWEGAKRKASSFKISEQPVRTADVNGRTDGDEMASSFKTGTTTSQGRRTREWRRETGA
ncbi:hypothetical protein PIB30_078705, partial [Stylosanthes scabra]|nr:hypothetical protein [Stylosanthes scabra]